MRSCCLSLFSFFSALFFRFGLHCRFAFLPNRANTMSSSQEASLCRECLVCSKVYTNQSHITPNATTPSASQACMYLLTNSQKRISLLENTFWTRLETLLLPFFPLTCGRLCYRTDTLAAFMTEALLFSSAVQAACQLGQAMLACQQRTIRCNAMPIPP